MTQTFQRVPNRWVLAAGGVLMQIALGAVYAWSVFRDPLVKGFGWSIPQVTWAFSIAVLVLGFGAFFGDLWMNRVGPRVVGSYAGALTITGWVMLVSTLLPVFLRGPTATDAADRK